MSTLVLVPLFCLDLLQIMDDNKIQLHGIIGSDFLIKHKYILDFADKVAYHK